jgi:hypothetical protein
MHVPKCSFFLLIVIVSLPAFTQAFHETVSQRDSRLKKEAQNITQQSPSGQVYSSILMMGEPALRVDVDASSPLNRDTEKGNTEWAAELFSMGFKRYVIVHGDTYWVFTTGEQGFEGDLIGKSSDLPAADNALAMKNASTAPALKAQWPIVLKRLGVSIPTENLPSQEAKQTQEKMQVSIDAQKALASRIVDDALTITLLKDKFEATQVMGYSMEADKQLASLRALIRANRSSLGRAAWQAVDGDFGRVLPGLTVRQARYARSLLTELRH